MPDKKKLFVSFSGGATSGYMTKYLIERHSDTHEIVVVFANTGEEREETLEFVHKCDTYFGFNTVWVEGVTQHGQRISSKHKVVTYETASRKGEPFEDMIVKYGIPNKAYPHCTRELKLNPMTSYMREIGWVKGSYSTAIGIRIDETRRVRADKEAVNIVYPLVDENPKTKEDINLWWDTQPFRLNIEEHQGNCKWCWKKSFRKHMRLLQEDPTTYDFPERMEALYGLSGHNIDGTHRVFFRGNQSTKSLRDFANNTPELIATSARDCSDEDGGCSESCEVYATESTNT